MSVDRRTPSREPEPRALTNSPLPQPREPGRPPGWSARRLVGVLLAVAVIAAALILSTRGPAATTPPASTPTTTPASANFLSLGRISCVNDAAWSPSGDMIAFVGPTAPFCGRSQGIPNQIEIYQAGSHSAPRSFSPDAAILSASGLASTTYGQILSYSTIRWSPNGRQLALSFTDTALGTADNPVGQILSGIVLINADGSNERVLFDRRTGPIARYTIWDLQTGTPVAVPANTAPSDPATSLVPAQSYSWAAGGMLAPGAPFASSDTSPPAGQVGNPVGSATFGLWQPGTISVIVVPASEQGTVSYLYLYDAAFAAWSPDGRYFADGLHVRGLVRPAGVPLPPPSVLAALQQGLDNVAELPIRDAALSEAIAHDVPQPVGTTSLSNPPVPIAWRADGKALAVFGQHNGYIIRATATGQVLKSVDVMELPAGTTNLPGYPGTWDAPLWSPDSKWLLLPTLALIDTSHLGI